MVTDIWRFFFFFKKGLTSFLKQLGTLVFSKHYQKSGLKWIIGIISSCGLIQVLCASEYLWRHKSVCGNCSKWLQWSCCLSYKDCNCQCKSVSLLCFLINLDNGIGFCHWRLIFTRLDAQTLHGSWINCYKNKEHHQISFINILIWGCFWSASIFRDNIHKTSKQ